MNVCPQTLDLDADENDWFLAAVSRAGLTPDQVVVEVTERFGGRAASVVKSLRRMKAQGFKIALDDVGTGNSGLAMLQNVGADYLKIDRAIVAASATEPAARAVLLAMATFADKTGAIVIAEGIEDEATLEYLRHLDRDQLSRDLADPGGAGVPARQAVADHAAARARRRDPADRLSTTRYPRAIVDREELRNERLVKNEQAARAYNNRRLQFEVSDETEQDEDVPFLCECGDEACAEAMEMTPDEFISVPLRAEPVRRAARACARRCGVGRRDRRQLLGRREASFGDGLSRVGGFRLADAGNVP